MKFEKLLQLLENKEHFIKKLKNLSDDEKKQIIDFYSSKNWNDTLEKMIDWSNPNLTFDDFKTVLNYVSKTGREKAVKISGITGLKEGEDYLQLKTDGTYQAYRLLNYEASKLIASDKIGGCVGKWCTAYQKSDLHWKSYTKSNVIVYVIAKDRKYALLVKKQDFSEYKVYNRDDYVYDDDKHVWLDESNNMKEYKILKFDTVMLDKFEKLISDNEELLKYKYKVKIDMSKYLNGNIVDLRNVEKYEIQEILIDSVDYPQYTFILPKDCIKLFEGSVVSECGSNWNTSNVTNMAYMFSEVTSAKPDVSKWDVSKVTDMTGMFMKATSANPDVSRWDVSKVIDMSGMFNDAKSANPDVSKWNVSNVIRMNSMFSVAKSANPDVSKWDVSKVNGMAFMFNGATLANPDVSKWDISNVTYMQFMFNGATLANPDVSNWNVSNIFNMRRMFKEATSAKLFKTGVENWMKYENISSKFETVDALKKEIM